MRKLIFVAALAVVAVRWFLKQKRRHPGFPDNYGATTKNGEEIS